jgi:aspartate aminotransferase-like enzyme
MLAYEKNTPAYFATPPVNLIYAYQASLSQITKSYPTLEERFAIHQRVSQRVKDSARGLGLRQVPLEDACAANGMTAVRSFLISPIKLLTNRIIVTGEYHIAVLPGWHWSGRSIAASQWKGGRSRWRVAYQHQRSVLWSIYTSS